MKTVNVVAAIITSEGKIYATQRGYGEFKDGWEFPGGKVEPGETAGHVASQSPQPMQFSFTTYFMTVSPDF